MRGELLLKDAAGTEKSWADYGRPHLVEVPDHLRIQVPPLLAAAASHGEALGILTAAIGLSSTNPTKIVETPVEKVVLRRELLEHVVGKRPDAREQYGNFLVPTLLDPYEVWITPYEGGGRTRYIGLFQGMINFLVVARASKDGSIFWNFIRSNPKVHKPAKNRQYVVW
ncbi:MAG: hypothetical protein HQL66_09860 [Magnetococcales bacterium]|nr:hypothetical protein [Magnetococcales bacterium]